jgi:hypothetical protein
MGDTMNDWSMMWGAKVKLRNEMPDDMLKDAIDTSRRALEACADFESDGLACAETIKTEFDTRYVPGTCLSYALSAFDHVASRR